MLMHDSKKKSVSLIMGKMLGGQEQAPSEAPSTDGVENDDSMAMDTAASELADAMHSKSPKRIVEAFKAMLELCDSDEPSEASEPAEPAQP